MRFMQWVKEKYPGWKNISEQEMFRLNDAWDAAAIQQPGAEIWSLIKYLRKEEADCITILCENPEPPPNQVIECSGQWTMWKRERFEGDTTLECLQEAVVARKKYEADPPCLFCEAKGKVTAFVIGRKRTMKDCVYCKGSGRGKPKS